MELRIHTFSEGDEDDSNEIRAKHKDCGQSPSCFFPRREKYSIGRSVFLRFCKAAVVVFLTFFSFTPSVALGPESQLKQASSKQTSSPSPTTAGPAALNVTAAATELTTDAETEASHSLALLLLLLEIDVDNGVKDSEQYEPTETQPMSLVDNNGSYKSSGDEEDQQNPFLVICTVDGDIVVLNANDGTTVCSFNSGIPLVGPSEPLDEDNEGYGDFSNEDFSQPLTQRRIVPGLDGQLYVTAEDGFLKPLEITVLDVLANPVKTCESKSPTGSNSERRDEDRNHRAGDIYGDIYGDSDSNNEIDQADDVIECGIVTATKSTSLFALDSSTGNLVWHQYPNGTTLKMDDNERENYEHDRTTTYSRNRKKGKDSRTTVLLQREDIVVQQVSTDTGASVWNVTLGTLQALEFGDADGSGVRSRSSRGEASDDQLPQPVAQGLLPSGDETIHRNDKDKIPLDDDNDDLVANIKLPHVVFSEDGTSLTAVDPSQNSKRNDRAQSSSRVLWSREFPNIVASVFGLNGKSWEPLTVLDENGAGATRSTMSNTDTPLLPQPGDLYEYDPADLETDSTELIVIDSNKIDDGEFLPAYQTDRLNHGRDSLFRNAIHQHRRRQQAPPLFPLIDEGIDHFTPNHLQIASSEGYTKAKIQPIQPLFCLSSSSNLCVSIDTQGLHLRWPILFLAALCVAVGAIVAYRRLYEQKKINNVTESQLRRWPELTATRASRVSFKAYDELMAHSADGLKRVRTEGIKESIDNDPGSNVNNRNNNFNITNNPALVKTSIVRSQSLPGNMDQTTPIPLKQGQRTPSTKPSTSSGSPKDDGTDLNGSTPTQASESTIAHHGVGLIDGSIPLIQYTRYASEFEEIGALGKGGFGSVFQCRNALDKREYAIKKVRIRSDSKLPQSDFTKRLKRTLREVKSLALLDHSNIVRYYTAWLELEQMNGAINGDNHSEGALGASDYYMMSPTRTSQAKSYGFGLDFSQSARSPMRKTNNNYHNFANPFGSGGGLPSVFANSFSSSSGQNHNISGVPDTLDDYGFVFDRSSAEDEQSGNARIEESVKNEAMTEPKSQSNTDNMSPGSKSRMNNAISFQSLISSKSSDEESSSGWSQEEGRKQFDSVKDEKNLTDVKKKELTAAEPTISQRYILYIQMQFCSQKTLADFLSNEEARKGPSGGSIGGIDIPYALSLFLQTCQGVEHVHSQGLIHRDLKPNNIFIDDTGAVKVGDFGLSRESTDSGEGGVDAETVALTGSTGYDHNADITAGVGTRSYASPEQMKGGSDYDSSTDIYSLGIILFELCYPMYTGMERNKELSKLRNHILPDDWMETVAVDFPKLNSLLLSMISNKPEDRPAAKAVVQRIQSILEGFTISSLDKRYYEGSILLRVEIMFRENGLHQTMDLLRQVALPNLIDIVQYGLRSSSNKGQMKSIMEFAIVPRPEQPDNAPECSPASIGALLVKTLSDNPQVLLIRQVSATKYT
mmetsp:Transcript_15936/g.36764  ORF Transcript_15936/g.36764 Transcript_15936/m.36764 type:complete len:1474 (+) Transcript_15936:148-4569(+)